MNLDSGIGSYELVPDWEQLPSGWTHLDVAGVAAAGHELYVLTRFDCRVIVYHRSGAFLRAWGEDVFSPRPHGITVADDATVWVTDEGAHVLRRFSPDGTPLQVIGIPGHASDTGADAELSELRERVSSVRRGGPPFNRPTNVAVAPSGDVYATDGYGNARVHQFTPGGDLVRSWGSPGGGPGEFRLPHDILVTQTERVLVADRENDRVQVFDLAGRYLTHWELQRPAGLAQGPDGVIVVAEMSRQPGQRSFSRDPILEVRPGRISFLDEDGTLLDRWPGGLPECAPGNFTEPHSVAVDSDGTVYVGEVTRSGTAGRKLPEDCHTLQVFAPTTGRVA